MAEEIADRLCIVDRGRVNFLGTLSALQQELALPHTSLEPLFLKLTANGDGEVMPAPQPTDEPIEGPR